MDRRVLWRSSWALWRIKRVHVEISADVPLQQAGKDLGGSGGTEAPSSRNARYKDRAKWSLHIRKRDPDSAAHPD
jgi:hypothetical protein